MQTHTQANGETNRDVQVLKDHYYYMLGLTSETA